MPAFSSTIQPPVLGSAPVPSIGANTPGLPKWYTDSIQNTYKTALQPQAQSTYDQMVNDRLNGIVRSGPTVDANEQAKVTGSPLEGGTSQPLTKRQQGAMARSQSQALNATGQAATDSMGTRSPVSMDYNPDKSRVVKAMEKSVGAAKTVKDAMSGIMAPLKALVPEAVGGAVGPLADTLGYLMNPTTMGAEDMTSKPGTPPTGDALTRNQDFITALKNAGVDPSGLYNTAAASHRPVDPKNPTPAELDKMNSGLLGMVGEKDLAGVLPASVMDDVRQHMQNGGKIDDAVEMALDKHAQDLAASSPLNADAGNALKVKTISPTDVANKNDAMSALFQTMPEDASAARSQNPALITGQNVTYLPNNTELPDAKSMAASAHQQIQQKMADLAAQKDYMAKTSRDVFQPGPEGDYTYALAKNLFSQNKGFSDDAGNAAKRIDARPDEVATIMDNDGQPQQVRNGMVIQDDGTTVLPRPGMFPSTPASFTGMTGTNRVNTATNYNTTTPVSGGGQ